MPKRPDPLTEILIGVAAVFVGVIRLSVILFGFAVALCLGLLIACLAGGLHGSRAIRNGRTSSRGFDRSPTND